MKPIINIDVDGTLADFTGHALSLAGSKRKPRDIRNYNLYDAYEVDFDNPDLDMLAERDRVQWMIRQAQFYTDIPVLPGCYDFVQRLKAYDASLQYVTRPYDVHGNWYTTRIIWLANNFGTRVAQFYPVADKTTVFGHVFLDDRLENVERWQRMWEGMGTAFLVDAHHNVQLDTGGIERIYITAENARQTADYVMKVAEQHATDPRWDHMPKWQPQNPDARLSGLSAFDLKYVIDPWKPAGNRNGRR